MKNRNTFSSLPTYGQMASGLYKENKDNYKTDVIFRNNQTGDIFALFPYLINTNEGSVMSYEHIGQHSGADYDFCVKETIPAKENEYKDLFEGLESIGYNLRVIKRRNYAKYLKALYKSREG